MSALNSLGIIMKARFVFACAAAGIALLTVGAPTAAADGHTGTLKITPGEVRPGEVVTLTATCDYPEFTSPAHIETPFLVPVPLTGEKDEAGVWHLSATTTVRPDVKPGTGSALFSCGPIGDVTVGEFTILPPENPYAAIGIDDDEILAGQEVRVSANCRDPRFVSSQVFSPVLSAPDLVRSEGADITAPMFSVGKVDAHIKPGTFPLSFMCVDREVTGEFTVTEKTPAKTPVKAQVPVKPKGPADTGSLDEPESDAHAVLIGAGAAVLLVAGGVGVWAHRRRDNA
jgi:hypothetical protein